MTEPIFDHEKVDVYRMSIEYAVASCGIASTWTGTNRPIRDPWRRAAQSVPLNIARETASRVSRTRIGLSRSPAGRLLECAAIHDILKAFVAVDEESSRQGQSQLRRIVSMMTRLIQRSDRVAPDAIEYEYEYRDAEYE